MIYTSRPERAIYTLSVINISSTNFTMMVGLMACHSLSLSFVVKIWSNQDSITEQRKSLRNTFLCFTVFWFWYLVCKMHALYFVANTKFVLCLNWTLMTNKIWLPVQGFCKLKYVDFSTSYSITGSFLRSAFLWNVTALIFSFLYLKSYKGLFFLKLTGTLVVTWVGVCWKFWFSETACISKRQAIIPFTSPPSLP